METITYLRKQTAAQVTPSCPWVRTSHCHRIMNNVLQAQWQGLWTPIYQAGIERRSHRQQQPSGPHFLCGWPAIELNPAALLAKTYSIFSTIKARNSVE